MGASVPQQNNGANYDGSPGASPAAPGPAADIITALQKPDVNSTPSWGEPAPQVIANPNQNYANIAGGAESIGINPNTDITAGVPQTNTPAINSQGTPGFGLNSISAGSSAIAPANIIASLMQGGSMVPSYAG